MRNRYTTLSTPPYKVREMLFLIIKGAESFHLLSLVALSTSVISIPMLRVSPSLDMQQRHHHMASK